MSDSPMRGRASAAAPDVSVAYAGLVADVHACVACPRVAHSHVLGEANGPLDAKVMFVAEAVGRRGGAVTGVPLSRDESGKRFTSFLAVAGLRREDVFITNAVLCNPLDGDGCNRTPSRDEMARCRPFLARTLDLVSAPLVVALGRVALDSLAAIAPHEAMLGDPAAPVAWRGRRLAAMYHPSRQSTLHRAHDMQEADWRRLGDAVASACRAGRLRP